MKKFKGIACGVALSSMLLSLTGCFNLDNLNDGGTSGINIEGDNSNESNDELNFNSIEAKVEDINNIVDNYFYFDIDNDKREEAIYDGLLDGLDDPYSQYYTPTEFEALMEENEGSYVGIGSTVTQDIVTKEVFIVKPMKGSPALEAGLLPGDQIIMIDDLDIEGMDLDLVVKKIRGEENTVANITIIREGEEEPLVIPVERRVVENITVEYEVLEDNIGYISIAQFIDNTPKLFFEAMDDLQAQGVNGVVIDLRNNPGGLLTAVVEMCDYYVEGGLIVYTEDKNGNTIEEYKANDGEESNLQTVVLTNGNSASASEIFTGCLKDYDKATIVGTTTYGKGIVQSVVPLEDGSAIKLTIAKYFTPKGQDIHGIGIAPDIEVELPEELQYQNEIPHEEDTQLQKALEQFE